MLDNLWYYGVEYTKHPRYQLVEDFTYWYVFGSFNNWNIIQFTYKTTSSKDFDAVHKVVLEGIIDNM